VVLENIGSPDTIITCENTVVALNPDYDPSLVYDWSFHPELTDPTTPNPIVSIDKPTEYIVQISDSTGICQFEKIVLIDTMPTIPINIKTIANCDGKGITFLTEESGIYTWEFGDGTPSIESNGTTIEHTYDAFGNYEVSVQYTPINGCASTQILPISVVSGIEANFDWSAENCTDTTIELVVEDQTKTTQDPINTWLWELSDGRTATGPTPVFEINDTNALHVKLTVSSTNNPSCMASIEIAIPTLLIDPSTLQDTIAGCIGELIALNPNPSIEYTYDWSDNEGIDLVDPNNPIVTIDGNKTYSGIISNEFGCIATKVVNIETTPTIEVEITPDFYFCEPSLQTELFAYSDQAQQQWWLNAAGDTIGVEPEIEVLVSQSEQFSVILQDEHGCTTTQNINISTAPLDLSFIPVVQICQTDTIQLEVLNNTLDRPLTFSWSPKESILTITIESDNNFIYSGETIALAATEDSEYTYNWTPSSSLDNPTIARPIASPTENTEYQLTVTNEQGCTASASIGVEVQEGICEEPYIFLPNAFTPDGDGENDILYLRGAIISTMELIIYDRWGDEIFRSFSPDIGWDGTKQGKAQSAGVFGYYLFVECINGEEFRKQGNVSLLR